MKHLYSLVREFAELAPWQWMENADVFGVEDPATHTVGWCVVLGEGEEVYGLYYAKTWIPS